MNNTGNDLGLIYMNARYYLPEVGRFISADTIVPDPGNPQSYNRYSYVNNNPVNNTDPTGHWLESALDIAFIAYDLYDIQQNGLDWINGASLVADVAGLIIPVATGGGVAVRALAHGDDVAHLAGHLDEAIEASHITKDALRATQTTKRFSSVGGEAIPDILKAFSDEGRVVGELSSTFKGRQTRVIGKMDDTSVAGEFGELIITTNETGAKMLDLNAEWISQGIERGDVFYLASQINSSNLANTQYGISVFGRELDALLQAGYQRVGDYLAPPR